ncbi:MAG: HAD family hydrolase [Gammaproteobacteria bacterium]|jgi:pseudouridine-5'-monophosphatase|nr:HAD family hydrolase [Gammaproteobacteria bacterium]
MNSTLEVQPAGIIFDLDGTLLDTEPLYTDATQRLLDLYGHTFTMELKKRCLGGDSRRSAQMTIDEYTLPLTVDEYLTAREVHLLELFPTSPEIHGAGEFMTRLMNTKLLLGLATSSHKHLCDIKLENKAWKAAFTSIICGDNAAVKKGKPEPDIFLVCAAALGLAAGDCIAFEDSPNGIRAARAAGMRVIAVNGPYVDLEDLREADSIIDSYEEILPVVARW